MPPTSFAETGLSPLVLGDLCIPLPIVQGGMGVGISMSGLASAVANEGGLGTIASVGIGMLEKDLFSDFVGANIRVLRREIRRAREATKGALAVNIMVAMSEYAEYVRAAVEEGIDVIVSGAGLPLNLPELVPDSARTKLVPIVSSARAAALICKRWFARYGRLPDAMVLEGPMAGGHLGFEPEQIDDPAFSLDRLIPKVVSALAEFEAKIKRRIPLIAAGGIYTGADMRRVRELGASAVQMGTRFVATHECDASDAFKQAYVNCRKEDLTIIRSPVGLPGRAIRNAFIEAVGNGQRGAVRCPYKCIITCPGAGSVYCIAHALINAKLGKLKRGFAFAGANAWRTTEIVSVREVIQSLLEEYRVSVCGAPAAAAL